jgi:hypothetical protein
VQARAYDVLGVEVVLQSDVEEILAAVDATYAAFRTPVPGGEPFRIQALRGGSDTVDVDDSSGLFEDGLEPADAVAEVLVRLVQQVLGGLHDRGIQVVHAAALEHRGRALIVSGRTGEGKTTTALGLLGRGLRLLSDEFAVVEPGTTRLLPYRRSLHVRAGTPELVPALAFLADRPRASLGGGIEWVLSHRELAKVLPGALAEPAPLGHVLVLDGPPDASRPPSITPVPAAVAAVELLAATYGTALDFDGALARLSELFSDARCGRLQTGRLDRTTELVLDWLEERHG